MKRIILPNGNVVSDDYYRKNCAPSEEHRSVSFCGMQYTSDIDWGF